MDLEELNITDTTDLILRAVAFAAHKHRDQRRKDLHASPYINHPIALANILVNEAGIHDPEVLILDEPTTGLDPNQLVEIRELIRNIGKEKTVILSTHIMQEVEAICDRVIIISKGQIVADDTAKTLQQELEHQTVYVEFDAKVTKSQLSKIPGISKVEALDHGWLIESVTISDLRKAIAQYAQKENWLILTLKVDQKSLEEVFKELTK